MNTSAGVAKDKTVPITGKDLILLLLYCPTSDEEFNAPIKGRTRLAKILFLFEREVWPKFKLDKLIPSEVLPEFKAWRFGPFSKDVFNDIDFFRTVGFIETNGESEPAPPEEAIELDYWSGEDSSGFNDRTEPDEYSEEEFALTDDGVRYVEERRLWDRLSNEQQQAFITFKKRLATAPLYVILRYVYENYPDMATKSEIANQVLG